MRWRIAACLAFWGMQAFCKPVFAQAVEPVPDISLEDLINTEVISASRRSQSLQQMPAAVFVISHEDIVRSGARSLADVLGMAPGIEVAKLGNNRWSVTARGFSGRFANKLQVLKDGRSIYTPPFSSVFWEAEDMVLQDIDHIEIIRGPDAALWGANSVNGTINIVTRKARDTQGALLDVSAGTEDKSNVSARYGTTLGDSGYMRLYAKSVDRRAGYKADGSRATDWGTNDLIGFRTDWLLSSGNRLSLSGEYHNSRNADTYNVATPLTPSHIAPVDSVANLSGGHLQARYESLHDDGSEIVIQSYLTQSTLDFSRLFRDERQTIDLDLQYRFAPSGSHDLMAGANYRTSTDKIDNRPGSFITFARPRVNFELFGVFVNDEITLIPDRFRVTLGARVEHNTTSGMDVQPTARFLWTPNAEQTVWGALSRATRTPSLAEGNASMPVLATSVPNPMGIPPTVPALVTYNNQVKDSERMDALEVGYRHRLGPNLSIDATAFVQRYRDGITVAPQGGQLDLIQMTQALATLGYVPVPLTGTNGERSRIYGIELSAYAQITPGWRLKPAYTLLRAKSSALGDHFSEGLASSEMAKMPRHQLSLRSQFDLSRQQQLDFWLKYKSATRFEATEVAVDVPARTDLDIRYAWKPTRDLEISLVGQNLLHRRTLQYLPDQLPSAPVETGRGAYLRVEYRF